MGDVVLVGSGDGVATSDIIGRVDRNYYLPFTQLQGQFPAARMSNPRNVRSFSRSRNNYTGYVIVNCLALFLKYCPIVCLNYKISG